MGWAVLTGLLALAVTALFTGAAVYVNVAEQPARLVLEDRPLLAEWSVSYPKGLRMQAPLAIVGFLLAALAWWQTGRLLWLAGGIALLANWPYTLLAIMPTNHALEATPPAEAGAASRRLIERWGGLHAGRSALGALATLLMIWAASQGA